MKHLGDITKLSGHYVPIVDCVIGGSPCQGMSVAGKMEGLNDDRSVLFYDQVRIVKEMREQYVRNTGRTDNIRPRYMVWENVAGAISVGTPKGEDFRLVLEETAKIKDENAVIPRPPKGKWSNAGCIMGNGFSIAWRIFDNQFWGTPQRRRRIALVADFGGESAPEILFVRKSLSGDLDESQPKGQGVRSYTEGGVGTDGKAIELRGGAIGANVYNFMTTGDAVGTLTSGGYTSTGTSPKVIVGTVYAIDQGGGKSQANVSEGVSPTLTCTHGGEPAVCYKEKIRNIVRRIIPLEAERLQGFPDGWTDIGDWTDSNGNVRKTSDTARYKALGNSIALPAWKWIIKRISSQYERDATMASLFDGIGGFPLLWEQLNGKGSCLWASEIEEFPIAVTKKRIGGD